MNIRMTTPDDLPRVLAIYEHAREQMRRNGNPTQWGASWPPEPLLREDVRVGRSYLVVDGAEICGVFVFFVGEDETYRKIDGAWLNDERYGVLHRIASAGIRPGVLRAALDFCEARVDNMRVDTHPDNAIMRKLLTRFGYTPCGIIYVREDSYPRIAFQKKLR